MDIRAIQAHSFSYFPFHRKENIHIFVKIQLLEIAIESLRSYHRSLAELKILSDQGDKVKQQELTSDKRAREHHNSRQMALEVPPSCLWTPV